MSTKPLTYSLLHLLPDLVPQLVLVELRLPVLPVEDAGHGALDAAPQVLVRWLRTVGMGCGQYSVQYI